MKNGWKIFLGNCWKFITPIVYLLVWVLIIKFAKDLGLQTDGVFIFVSLVILFFGIISKSTSWSIGHEKFGIKGDSTSKKVEFCADGVGTIKIFDDDMESREKLMKEAGKIIKNLKS
jgi:hypothetical protein